MSVRLGELLTKASLITQDQLKEALKRPEGDRRQARRDAHQARLRRRGRHHRVPVAAVRRAVDQPRALRDRLDRHQADPGRRRPQIQHPSGQQDRRHDHDRHGRSDERLRHGRHQVHDRLQRRAGRGLRARDQGGHRQLLRHHLVARAEEGHGRPSAVRERRPRGAGRGRGARRRRAGRVGRRSAGRQARATSSSPTPSSAARPTSTSSRTRKSSASASASTACCTRS